MGTNLRAAFKSLMQNRLQALLTLSGMTVGVAMVVLVSGLGRGAQLTIEKQIESAGPTLITVRSGNLRPAAIGGVGEQDTSGGEQAEGAVSGAYGDLLELDLTETVAETRTRIKQPPKHHRTPATPLGEPELRLLRKDIDDVRSVAALIEGNRSLSGGDSTARVVRLQGYEESWPEMRGWRLLQGRFPNAKEFESGAPVAVVSQRAAERLWPDAVSVIDRRLPFADGEVRVLGVIANPGKAAEQGAAAIVPLVHVPLVYAQKALKRETFDSITVRTTSVAATTRVAKDITAYLRQIHQLQDDELDDFRVETQSVSAMPSMGLDPRLARSVHANAIEFEQASWEEMAKSMRRAGRTFTLLLAAAAAVSLLVGGIGVMNIMLVSVVARTREIGLRMAIGARTRDVLTQFMVEAIVLAVLGGLIGLAFGALGLMVARHGLHWATAIEPTMLIAAITMAALTGIVFGYGPARRAAMLDPVVALKAE